MGLHHLLELVSESIENLTFCIPMNRKINSTRGISGPDVLALRKWDAQKSTIRKAGKNALPSRLQKYPHRKKGSSPYKGMPQASPGGALTSHANLPPSLKEEGAKTSSISNLPSDRPLSATPSGVLSTIHASRKRRRVLRPRTP